MLLLSLAFSRCSFSKTEQNGTGHDSSGGMIKRGSFWSGRVGSGRVGSGRVGLGERLDPSLTLFRSTLTIASFIVHFVLLAKRLKQAVLSLDKLSKKKTKKKAVMQNKRDYHIYFLRVSSGAIYYERGIERKNECIHPSYT